MVLGRGQKGSIPDISASAGLVTERGRVLFEKEANKMKQYALFLAECGGRKGVKDLGGNRNPLTGEFV